MEAGKTTIKVSKDMSDRLKIAAILNKKTKEKLIYEILEQGLKPYEDKIKILRFK